MKAFARHSRSSRPCSWYRWHDSDAIDGRQATPSAGAGPPEQAADDAGTMLLISVRTVNMDEP